MSIWFTVRIHCIDHGGDEPFPMPVCGAVPWHAYNEKQHQRHCMRRAATPTARTAHRKVQTKTYIRGLTTQRAPQHAETTKFADF